MKPGLNLSLRPSLQLKLAPQLIQSLKMLQMPLLKLEQTLRHELAINPLLEEMEVEEPVEDSTEDSEFEVTEDKDSEDKDEFDWDQYLYDDDEGYKVKQPYEQTEDRFEGSAAKQENLYDHLGE